MTVLVPIIGILNVNNNCSRLTDGKNKLRYTKNIIILTYKDTSTEENIILFELKLCFTLSLLKFKIRNKEINMTSQHKAINVNFIVNLNLLEENKFVTTCKKFILLIKHTERLVTN